MIINTLLTFVLVIYGNNKSSVSAIKDEIKSYHQSSFFARRIEKVDKNDFNLLQLLTSKKSVNFFDRSCCKMLQLHCEICFATTSNFSLN